MIVLLFGLGVYSPALTRQIETLERDGPKSSAYRTVALRATTFGIAVLVPILAILFLMICKASL